MRVRSSALYPLEFIQERNINKGRFVNDAAKLKEVKDAGHKCDTCSYRKRIKLSHRCLLRNKWTQPLYICKDHKLIEIKSI